jgi:hypothetical protein
MKQSLRIISVLLSVVMMLTAVQISAFAAHTSYTSAGGYDILDNPYVTPAQAASMLLDMVDAMLAENNTTIPVDIYVGSKTIDLRSIDQATSSITDFWNWTWIDIAFAVLSFGDIEKMNMTWIENCPKRTAAGKTDLDVVLALTRFLKDNYDRIGKIIDDTFNYGFVETVTDLPPEIHDVPGTLKKTVLEALNDGVEPPAGTTVDSLVQKLIDGLVVGERDPETGKYDGFLPGLRGKTNIGTTSVYTLFTDAINAGIEELVVPGLSTLLLGLAGVEITPEFPGGNPEGAENLDMVIGLLSEIGGEIPYTPEDLETPLAQMNAALTYMLVEGGMDVYFYLDDVGLNITPAFVELFDGLIRVALTLIPNLGFLNNTKVFKTEEEVMAMSISDCYAYLARLLLNEFVEFADIPESASTVRSVFTYLLISLAKDVLPETNFDQMIAAGILNPFTDGIFTVAAPLMRYYLNGLLPIDIPAGLNFEQTIGFVFDWFIGKYGGLFYTGSILPTDTVWQKIDKVLFNYVPGGPGLIPLNWLPAQFTGSKYLVMDWLLGNILDFNYLGLLSIVKRNPNSELNNSVVKVLLNMVARFLKSAIGNNTILPMNLSSFEAIFTKANLRSTIQQLCRYLYDNGNSLLGTLFPLATQVLGIWSKETYIRKAPAGAPLVGIQALQSLLDSYTPRNLNADMQYDEPGYNFFGAEDFTELRNYFNYKQAKTEVQALLDAYAEDPETLDLQKNTDAAYRVTFYFNRLQKRPALSTTQLLIEMKKALEENEYLQEDYTAKSWAAYQKALNFAEKVRVGVVLGETWIRQSTISAARQNLFKAVKGLADFVPYADYTQLDMYINEAVQRLASIPAGVFTQESIDQLMDALVMAQGIDRLISYEEQATVDDTAAQLYTAIYGLTYILSPALLPIPNSTYDFWGNPITPVINSTRRFIYGLIPGGFSIEFFETVGGASVAVTPTQQGSGTGTRIRLSFGGSLLSTLTVVVFGDVNGDGNIDDGDSGQIIDYENYLYNWAGNADKRFAADVNGDGNIDSTDAGVVTDSLNYLKTIDQTTGIAVPIE